MRATHPGAVVRASARSALRTLRAVLVRSLAARVPVGSRVFVASRALVPALALTALGALHGGPSSGVAEAASRAVSSAAVEAANRSLGRGVNLGNALEAPREGEWGLTLEAGWFDLIADAGFDSVRVPIRWSAHTGGRPSWTIDESFFERVDWVLAQAGRTGLAAIVDMHHDDALMSDPTAHRARFRAMWRQIAERYADAPDAVLFELLNEPHGAFDADPAAWNRLLADTLRTVRRSNPTRAVLVGPVGYNGIGRLDELALPDDANLIVSVHHYEPFAFTHQGAGWASPVPPVGRRWYPATTDLADGVENWSWDTVTTSARGRLQVAFERQYAGLSLRAAPPAAPSRPTRLRLSLRGSVEADVGCAGADDELAFVGELVNAGGSWTRRSVDLSACPPDTERVALMNRSPGTAAFELRNTRLCRRDGCRPLVGNARQSIRASLRAAADWGRANDRPMHLGEFGAYERADLASRVRWTREVQRAARAEGLSTAYWEFGAGFGVYDPVEARWRRPLLDALLP